MSSDMCCRLGTYFSFEMISTIFLFGDNGIGNWNMTGFTPEICRDCISAPLLGKVENGSMFSKPVSLINSLSRVWAALAVFSLCWDFFLVSNYWSAESHRRIRWCFLIIDRGMGSTSIRRLIFSALLGTSFLFEMVYFEKLPSWIFC